MATIVNTPGQTSSDSGMGFVLSVIMLIIFVIALLYFGLPYLTNGFGSNSPQINIPDKVNINVQPNTK